MRTASPQEHGSGAAEHAPGAAEHAPRASERFFRAVIAHRAPVIVLFVLAALVGMVCKQLVGVNYDMNDYLPENTASTVALDTMAEEFDSDIPNARVMVPNVSLSEARAYKEKLAEIDGVTAVTWLDDSLSLEVPLELQDQRAVESYYKDSAALFTVTIDESKRIQTVDDIRALVGNDAALTGSAVSTAVATTSTVSEIGIITVAGIIVVLLVLLLTTLSWLDPLLILVGLGVGVAINGGSNLIFGEISFVTNAAGTILQIAIALDFSVFLLHRYEECRGSYATPALDMASACAKSLPAILSSGCTVMIGFLALTVMRFGIGPDLGFALAKGIAISLVTVFTFTPCLFVACIGLENRCRHRSFLPPLDGFARIVQKLCVPLACVFVLLPVPAFLASTSHDISYYYGASHIFGEETQLGADDARIAEVFGTTDTYVLMVPAGNVAQEAALSQALHEIPQVSDIISYVDLASPLIPSALADSATLSQIQSANYSRMVITVDADFETQETFDLVERVRATAQEHYPDSWLLAGTGVSTTDLMSTIVEDKDKVDILAMVAVLAVLLLVMRSLTLPVVLLFVIETSIWLNFSVPYFTGTNVFYLSYLIVSSVQLGVTVDYAILLTDRYKEFRRTLPKKPAIAATLKAVTVPVLTSGVVLMVVGFILSFVSSHGILAQLGHYLGVGVLMSLAAVLFVLPGFLYMLDGIIAKTTWRARFCMPAKKTTQSGPAVQALKKGADEL